MILFTEIGTLRWDANLIRKCVCVCACCGEYVEGRASQSMWSSKLNVILFEVIQRLKSDALEAAGTLRLALLRERSGLEGRRCILGPNDNSIINWWYSIRIEFSEHNPEFQVKLPNGTREQWGWRIMQRISYERTLFQGQFRYNYVYQVRSLFFFFSLHFENFLLKDNIHT